MKMKEQSLLSATRSGSLLLACAMTLGVSGCGSSSMTAPQNAGNFNTTVFIGDSLTAGYQNGSLLDTQQTNGYANLIAQQAKFVLALPLIASPGAPNVMTLVSPGPRLSPASWTPAKPPRAATITRCRLRTLAFRERWSMT